MRKFFANEANEKETYLHYDTQDIVRCMYDINNKKYIWVLAGDTDVVTAIDCIAVEE